MLPTYPHDFGVALGTDWSKELLVTALTVHIVLLLHEAHVRQGGLAVGTVELFWVPGTAHGYQKGAPGEAENGTYQGSPKSLRPDVLGRPTRFILWPNHTDFCNLSNELM